VYAPPGSAAADHILDEIAEIYAAHPPPTRADLDRAIATLEQLRDRGYPLRDRLLALLQEQRSEAPEKKSLKKRSP
jgi:hypothetical protein